MSTDLEKLAEHLVFISTLPQEVVEREGVELGTQLADAAWALLNTYESCVNGLNSLTAMLSEEDAATVWKHWNTVHMAYRDEWAQNHREYWEFLNEEEE